MYIYLCIYRYIRSSFSTGKIHHYRNFITGSLEVMALISGLAEKYKKAYSRSFVNV